MTKSKSLLATNDNFPRHFCLKSPAFQWYASDFLGSGKVAAMSLEEVGAYSLLLSFDWSETGLPDSMVPFTRWLRTTPAKSKKLWEIVRPNFVLRDGRWYNPRLDKERAKQHGWREKSSKGGQAGARARWGNGDRGGYSTLTPPCIPNDDTPSPTPSPITTKTDYPPDFELLWKAYPKREGANPKGSALKAYNARLRERTDFTHLLDGTIRYATYVQTKAWVGTEFVMQASRFYGPDKLFLESWETSTNGSRIIGVGGEPTADELRSIGIRL